MRCLSSPSLVFFLSYHFLLINDNTADGLIFSNGDHEAITTSGMIVPADGTINPNNISLTTTPTTTTTTSTATATTSTTYTIATTTTTTNSSSESLSTLFRKGKQDLITNAKERGLPFMALAVTITDTLPLLPTQPISILAGALFGFKTGLSAVVLGQSCAVAIAFLFGRFILKKRMIGGTKQQNQLLLVDTATTKCTTGDYEKEQSANATTSIQGYGSIKCNDAINIDLEDPRYQSSIKVSSPPQQRQESSSSSTTKPINNNNNEQQTQQKSTRTNNNNNKLEKLLQELTTPLNSGNSWTIFTTIFMIRQSPVLPFSVGNYFVGAGTNAALFPAWIGTILGCMPLNVVWVLTGSTGIAAVGTFGNHHTTTTTSGNVGGGVGGEDVMSQDLQHGLYLFGSVATLAFFVYVARTVRNVYSTTE